MAAANSNQPPPSNPTSWTGRTSTALQTAPSFPDLNRRWAIYPNTTKQGWPNTVSVSAATRPDPPPSPPSSAGPVERPGMVVVRDATIDGQYGNLGFFCLANEVNAGF